MIDMYFLYIFIHPSLRPAALHTCLFTDLANFWTHHGPQRRSARLACPMSMVFVMYFCFLQQDAHL